jgi:predicted nucleotidyltransferase component of viral defense system
MLNDIDEMLYFFNQTKEFVTAVQYTASKFEFLNVLVEKDFLCSIVLKYLYNDLGNTLVFKGGTLLSKMYTEFNRMSEDLDFSIPIPRNAARNQRSQNIKPVKEVLGRINTKLPIFIIKKPLMGHNNSCQYTMELNYKSNVTQNYDKILIDIGMRDELLMPAYEARVKTLLIDPFSENNKVSPFAIIGLHPQEAYAEKTRAALCRKELAIRDYYDLYYASANGLIDFENDAFLLLVKKKVQHETNFHDFNDPVVIKHLQSKVTSELEPTLKKDGIMDFNKFRGSLHP